MALAHNREDYTPPRVVTEMEEKYAPIMEVLDEGESDFLVWGWDKTIRKKLQLIGVSTEKLPTNQELEDIRHFSSREFCVEYTERFYQDIGAGDNKGIITSVVPNNMRMVSAISQEDERKDTVICKQLWSSSGRGNRIIKPTDRLPFSTPFIIDTFYDKILDFAMEFMIKDGGVEFLGYSVFCTNNEGKYKFNYVASQSDLEDLIKQKSGSGKDVLDTIRDTHIKRLKQDLAGRYDGPIGIDMLTTTDGLIHPCVELNLRMNMGILALTFFRRFGCERLREMSLDSLLDVLPFLH